MPRLRNSKTGAVVNVSEAIAARLSGYEPVEAEKPKPARKRAAKKAVPAEPDQ
jgi:hypothetical protein